MASPPHRMSSQELQPYGSEDAFDAYIDLDFLRNNSAMDEDVDITEMSNSDLFRYFLEGELAKDSTAVDLDQPEQSFPTPMQDIDNDFALLPSPVMSTEELKIAPLSPPPVTPISPTAEIQEPQEGGATTAAVAPSLAVLNAQLAELLAKLPLIKQEPVNESKLAVVSTASLFTKSHKPVTAASSISGGSATSPTSPNPFSDVKADVDLKKLSSKERRQLRNKISARNFRVRRKEYISNLESTNQQQQEEINLLRQALLHLKEENSKLQDEVEELRQQQTKSLISSPPSPPHISSKESNGVSLAQLKNNNGSNSRVNSVKSPVAHPHQPSSPGNRYLVIPNVNKDTPASPSQNQKTWQDTRVRVQTIFIPEFSLDKHIFQNKDSQLGHWPYQPSMFVGEEGQKIWAACMLFSTLMQQISTLFVEAVCAIPQREMIAALFPTNPSANMATVPDTNRIDQNVQGSEFLSRTSPTSTQETHYEDSNDQHKADDKYDPLLLQTSATLDSLVENAKEASVLDWLYDTMIRHVVEKSQVEARMHELQSDWVGEELEDNILHLLF